MNLLFCGDICFTGKKITKEESENILGEVIPYAENSDFVIANCETVLADKEKVEPIIKAGPNLIDLPENICFFETIKTDVAILANNHVGDFGEKGTMDTISLFEKHNIKTVGAGENIKDAYKACYIEKDGVKVSMIAVCENEFSIATEKSSGTAGFKIGLLHNRIKEEKQNSDYCIVVFHGGNEWNPMPSPKVKERYRLLCDIGADAVIAMHTHCPQGYEIYNCKPIVYSLGNFYFTSREKNEDNAWFYGYMVNLIIENGVLSIEPIPYKFDVKGTKITVFRDEKKNIMLNYINTLSKYILDDELVKNYFKGFVYRYPWSPVKIEDINSCLKTNLTYTGDYDLLSCEAHNEKLLEAFRIMMTRDIESAKYWAEKSEELERMPI